MSNYNKNILVTGYSGGAGKSYFIQNGILRITGDAMVSAKSYTTREPRGLEMNGEEYFFGSVLEFEELVTKRGLLEHTNPKPGIYYGSSKAEYNKARSAGKYLVYNVDYKGFEQLRKKLEGEIVTVVLLPPVWQRIEWMRMRGDMSDEEIIRRIEYSDKVERPFFENNLAQFDHYINDYNGKGFELFANKVVNSAI